MSDTLDAVVIGAGVVGLAVARALARAGREVVVLEAESRTGQGQSSRNSGVLHAGIYYPPGSLRARCCVAGRQTLYDYLAERGVGHRRCGKLVVAARDDERPRLRDLVDNARRCGVELELLDRSGIAALEPELDVVEAAWSPESGILDPHGLMDALQADLEAAGGQVLPGNPVEAVEPSAAFRMDGRRQRCRTLINAAGLGALALLEAGGWPDLPRQHFAAGHYYALRGRAPFRHLVYPLPGPVGLGIHLGLSLDGRARFGPDVRWVDAIDYRFDDRCKADFIAAIRRYWPAVRDDRLAPDMVGIRSKIAGPGEPVRDFVVDGPGDHGVPGVVNLLGIDSPGLTSALAIGEEVARLAST